MHIRALRKYITLIFAIVTAMASTAQTPVDVTTSLERVNDSTYVLNFNAVIEDGWHVYSTDAGEGPSSTELVIEKLEDCSLVGNLEADGKMQSVYDELFETEVRYFEKSARFYQVIKTHANDFTLQGYLQYSACNQVSCTPPTPVEFSFGLEQKSPVMQPLSGFSSIDLPTNELSMLTDHEELWTASDNTGAAISVEDSSLWLIFWTSFVSGLIAILTPCVWPIIPMTISFFIKRSASRKKSITDAMIYGLSIVIIYVLLGVLVSLVFDANQLNDISTNAVVNIIFTIMLLVFGLSFLGSFDLTLPSSWSTAVNIKATKSTGVLSLFLMAFTLSIVSFSCTGPIVGFLLVQISTYGSIIAPAVGMFGFALALALPFTLFAIFPSILSRLPRSGDWMTTMKVVLGVIEIAFALKFFSVADLAYGWHILDREVFIAIWIALSVMLSLYLWKVIKLKHDGEEQSISPLRCMLGVVTLAFSMYLVPGLWGAPLNAVSAFLPPMSTQDFNLNNNKVEAKFTNYAEGMLYARSKGQKVILDFTGYGCVNCREMEQKVWTNQQVAHILNNDYVLISLYTDDKTALPQKIEVEENGQKTTLRTVGDKWSFLQRRRFGINAQPFYVILNGDGSIASQPQAFTTDPEVFLDFLKGTN